MYLLLNVIRGLQWGQFLVGVRHKAKIYKKLIYELRFLSEEEGR